MTTESTTPPPTIMAALERYEARVRAGLPDETPTPEELIRAGRLSMVGLDLDVDELQRFAGNMGVHTLEQWAQMCGGALTATTVAQAIGSAAVQGLLIGLLLADMRLEHAAAGTEVRDDR